jgi:hypothetical protein
MAKILQFKKTLNYEINQQFFSKQCENYKLYNRLVNNYFIF